jgi:hypothetical protein
MAKESLLLLGPVLSFRGTARSAQGTTRWLITALVAIKPGTPRPAFMVDGRACPAPTVLFADAKQEVLRYDVSCDMAAQERKVQYGIGQGGPVWFFTVPGAGFAPRMAYVSCNGFSSPSGMRKLVRPANSTWEDLLCNHDRAFRSSVKGGYTLDKEQLWHEARTHAKGVQRFHLLLMGGDQIYFDSIWEELEELTTWVSLSRSRQLEFKVSATLRRRIETYYFSLYRDRWLPAARGAWQGQREELDCSDAMASIPTVMMWDDHDIFDGWGSYTPEMQASEVFQVLFDCARRAFWVFQMQHRLTDLPPLVRAFDSTVSSDDPHYAPISWKLVQAQDSLILPLLDQQPGFTYTLLVGPAAILVTDLRTERSRNQILGLDTWKTVQGWLQGLPDNPAGVVPRPGCQHLLVMSSVPIAHPKLSLAEDILDIFGRDHVLDSNADDLRDHWSHDDHEGERLRLVETLAKCAREKALRVSALSGDVHVAAWATIRRASSNPSSDWDVLWQFTSSAVVHPSLTGVFERLFLSHLNSAASELQKLDEEQRVQMMKFPGHSRYVMAARNWLAVELDLGTNSPNGATLWLTWRCEQEDRPSNHLAAVHPPMHP